MDTRPWEKTEIANRFKALRHKARLTQLELGYFIHIDRKSVCRIENLRTMPGPRTWRRFAEFESKHNQPKIELPKHWLEDLAAAPACRQ